MKATSVAAMAKDVFRLNQSECENDFSYKSVSKPGLHETFFTLFFSPFKIWVE